MTGAMYAAVSGLKAHMNKLNVIGNNVANVNTNGYKASRTVFKESLYTSLRGGSNGSAAMGGNNPAQFGYGCTVGTIDLDMSTKNYVPTGGPMDCMINGDGFFMVGPKPGTTSPTTGQMSFDPTDASGLNLTRVGNFSFDSEGYLVDGYNNVVYGFVTCSKDTSPGVCDKDDPAVSTQLVPIRRPLAYNAAPGDTSGIPNGSAIYPGVDADGKNVYLDSGELAELDSISIDGATGKITAYNKATKEPIVIGYIPLAQVENPNGVTHTQGPYYLAAEGSGKTNVSSIGDALDGKYLDNKTGTNTDDVAINGTGKTGLITGGLESSGTDVATEFSEMISTQRGYQANTRIITVTDSMLEELVNMKR